MTLQFYPQFQPIAAAQLVDVLQSPPELALKLAKPRSVVRPVPSEVLARLPELGLIA